MNFDEASQEWRNNKRSLTGGWFAYTCEYIHSNGNPCRRLTKSKKDLYATHPHWFTEESEDPNQVFCKQHRISGPRKAFFS